MHYLIYTLTVIMKPNLKPNNIKEVTSVYFKCQIRMALFNSDISNINNTLFEFSKQKLSRFEIHLIFAFLELFAQSSSNIAFDILNVSGANFPSIFQFNTRQSSCMLDENYTVKIHFSSASTLTSPSSHSDCNINWIELECRELSK